MARGRERDVAMGRRLGKGAGEGAREEKRGGRSRSRSRGRRRGRDISEGRCIARGWGRFGCKAREGAGQR